MCLKRFAEIESNPLWELLIIISVFVSVFGPPAGIIMGLDLVPMLLLIFFSNILFIFDSIFKYIKKKNAYLFSVDALVDISSIVAAIIEVAVLLGTYSGPVIFNLRVLRSFRLIGRSSRAFKAVVKAGKVQRSSGGFRRFLTLKTDEDQNKYLTQVETKINEVFMLLMGYIIIRFGNLQDTISPTQQAWNEIFFFMEIIIVMLIIGALLDYYLNKLIGQRFARIQEWLEKKSGKHGFFKEVQMRAKGKSLDEVDYLEQYLGIVLDKAHEFPESFRRFIWGVFQPKLDSRIIFLSDIENYSTKTQDMPAEKINRLLDSYVNHVVGILVKNGASIDKYVGDSIIAYFDPKDADRALSAAQQIVSIKDGKFLTRMGLHYDQVLETFVGPKGYRQMDNFSEGISIAQRLEEHNKKTRTYILYTDQFKSLLSARLQKRSTSLGSFKPKGASHKVDVYTAR